MIPTEPLQNLTEKVAQFRLFARRGYQVFSVQLDRFLTEEEMQTATLRDLGLVHNSKLIMKMPPKQIEEVPEEEDAEVYEDFDEAAMGAEAGEDEMNEFEEGEYEMSEPPEGLEEGEDEMEEHDAPDAGEFEEADEEGEAEVEEDNQEAPADEEEQ
jgi:hypothetical protein